MKFGKRLSNQIEETLPEWRDKILSYKDLKKKLKLMDPKSGERPAKKPRNIGGGMTDEEIQFLRLLEDEMEKFNSFFIEKEVEDDKAEFDSRLVDSPAANHQQRPREQQKLRGMQRGFRARNLSLWVPQSQPMWPLMGTTNERAR